MSTALHLLREIFSHILSVKDSEFAFLGHNRLTLFHSSFIVTRSFIISPLRNILNNRGVSRQLTRKLGLILDWWLPCISTFNKGFPEQQGYFLGRRKKFA